MTILEGKDKPELINIITNLWNQEYKLKLQVRSMYYKGFIIGLVFGFIFGFLLRNIL